ncbi:MAG: DUF3800 domain-containing protein [Anaerolineales bacterium]|nr:DUF3800 domain-containing protein [Anaerolineales bacterium]MCW5855585.1 DUF3800 domain-containing protein [Anaerolineales bacterium]
MFIDESGTKEYADDRVPYGDGRSRYFVFGGVLLENAEASRLTGQIIALKQEIFETKDVEVKSTWLRIPSHRENKYLKKYNISDERLTEFTARYYKILVASKMTLVASIVDKQQVQEDYGNPYYAPAIGYEVLLQRISQGIEGSVSVTIDDMSGSTPKMTTYKTNLAKQHRRLRQHGSQLIKGMRFDCLLPELKFTDSAKHHLVQVADSVAYNVFRQFRDHGEEWETKGLGTLPMYEYFELIVEKFRQGPYGRIQGYGVAKFPLRNRVGWRVQR